MENMRRPGLHNASPRFQKAPAPPARTQRQGPRSHPWPCNPKRRDAARGLTSAPGLRDFGLAFCAFVPLLSAARRRGLALLCVLTRFQGPCRCARLSPRAARKLALLCVLTRFEGPAFWRCREAPRRIAVIRRDSSRFKETASNHEKRARNLGHPGRRDPSMSR